MGENFKLKIVFVVVVVVGELDTIRNCLLHSCSIVIVDLTLLACIEWNM